MNSTQLLVIRLTQALLASALFAVGVSAAQITVNNSADTSLRADNFLPSSGANGGVSFMFVGQIAGTERNQFHSLLSFDLSNLSSLLPENARINSVSLQLAIEGRDSNSPAKDVAIQLYHLTQGYDEATANWATRENKSVAWDTAGGTYDGATLLGQTSVATDAAVGATYLWSSGNLLELFEQVYADGGELNMLLKKADDSVVTRELVRFITKENSSGSTLGPRLLIDYTVIPETSQVGLGLGAAVVAMVLLRRRLKR